MRCFLMQRNQNMVLVFSQVFQSISFNWIQEIIQLISTKNETTREKIFQVNENVTLLFLYVVFVLNSLKVRVRFFIFFFKVKHEAIIEIEVVVTLLFFTYISEHRFVI